MKLFGIAACFLTIANAERAAGKRGNTEVNNDRFIWQHPRCMADPALCDQCTFEFNTLSGNITISPEDYTNYKNCLWKINIPETKNVLLKFNKDHGFGIEYHRNCAYDKLHIYNNLNNSPSRISRFCGPKNGEMPFDGSRNLQPVGGLLEMWDTPLDTWSNRIMISFETDQKFSNFQGFDLTWESENKYNADFTNHNEALTWANGQISQLVQGELMSSIRRNTQNLLSKATLRLSAGEDRACRKSMDEKLSGFILNDLKRFDLSPMDFSSLTPSQSAVEFQKYVTVVKNIVLFYMFECNGATNAWNNRVNNLVQKYQNKVSG